MSKVIMMCGVCGSGKTTYAKKKEQERIITIEDNAELKEKRTGRIYPTFH